MRNTKLIEAFKKVREGIKEIEDALTTEVTEETAPKKEAKKVTEKKVAEESPVEEDDADDAEETVEGRFNKADLDAMKYNDLKKLGKELGVKCTGTREEITEKILAVPVDEQANDEEPDEAPSEDNKVVPMKKISKKKEPVEDEDNSEDDIEEEYLQKAREALEEYELSDVVEVLKDAGVKLTLKEKKQEDIVMHKLAEAIRDDKVALDDDEDSDEGEEIEPSEDSDLEFSEDSYFAQYDPEGVNDPDSMSKKRAKAVKNKVAQIIEAVESEEISADDIKEVLDDVVNEDEAEMLGEDFSEEELVAFFIEVMKRFIDNDGEEHEMSDPYELGEENYCCGHQLKYSKKNKKYICEVCGEEYEE